MSLRELPWGLWRRQVAAIMRLEVRKNFLGRRSFLLYLLVILPLFPISLALIAAALWGLPEDLKELGATLMFANVVFQGFILRFSMYLGCVWIFMNLFRGEILDRSLHYYFLAPVRREVLVVGKFLSGWVTATLLFGGVTFGSFVLLHLSFGVSEAGKHLLGGPGMGQLAAYLGITALGCLGYGAVFLLVGLFFRNPIVPAILIWGWEVINYLLPPALKKVSVIHYLLSLSPVSVTEGPFAILASPTPAWLSVPGLLLFSSIVLLTAGLRIRHMEIQYATD